MITVKGVPPVALALAHLLTPDRPLIAVRTNVEDGILVSSYLNRSMKQDLAAASIYNPVTVGLMAAMAIPAFQKVRSSAQEKALLNNLRQLAAAADQYYLETGTSRATYDQLVGPDGYIRVLSRWPERTIGD
jgi:type IV pilus assembly protein PilA